MPVPQAVKDWLRRTYPRPTVNPEWLEACCDWITSELNVAPAQTDDFIRHVDAQLLQSDLADSMLPGTGFPAAPAARIAGPVLCQVAALSDIGHSAFSLQTTRQNRIDKADMTGLALAQGDEEAAEDEGPIPRYPRGMLRFQLSDGSLAINAIEYRKIPQFVLGETPLGYKLIVRNALVRGGYIFLEPACVTLKGYACEDLDANRDRDFARGLRLRLGQPEDAEDGAQEDRPPSPPAPAPAPAPAPVPAQRQPAQRQPSPPARHRTDDDEFEDTPFADLDDATLAHLDTPDRRAPPPAPKSEEAEEFEFDDDSMVIDDDVLAMVDKLEHEHEHAHVAPPSDDTMVSSSSGQGARRSSVIEIDSGDDEDAKDARVSIPPPSQRPRPASQRRPPIDDNVIEISD
ncbi:hypothetical protein AURDEDRAFT_183151 [Auricularia subglabra TFB-10046 SS5]|nr:hypothetical protein AURDEDRAFT_183151 [Auricularia subglabra TFB-10046 SS5]